MICTKTNNLLSLSFEISKKKTFFSAESPAIVSRDELIIFVETIFFFLKLFGHFEEKKCQIE
jgi:hypothetical protein